MKNAIQKYSNGDLVALEMQKGEFGNRPIARTNEGIICLVDKSAKGYYPYGSIWTCKVVEVSEKKLIVCPLELCKSAAANAFEAAEKARIAFGKSKQITKNKSVRHFPFKSQQEKARL
jgi:hypothetical protein